MVEIVIFVSKVIVVRIEDLKIFVDVVRYHSMSIAAEKNFTTPQNLSKIIKRMENELGVVLFKRSRKGSDLTEVGERFYLRVIEVLQDYNQAMFAIGVEADNKEKILEDGKKVIINVLCSAGVMSYAVMESYKKMRQKCRDLILEENEINSFEVKGFIDYVQERKFDIIACSILQEKIEDVVNALPDYLLVRVILDEVVLIVSKKNPLANRSMISKEEIKNLNMISSKRYSLANELIDINMQCQIMTNSHEKAVDLVRNSDSSCALLSKGFCDINKNEFGKDGNLRMIRIDTKIYGTNIILIRKNCVDYREIMQFTKMLEEAFLDGESQII